MDENQIPHCSVCGSRMAVMTAVGLIGKSNYIGSDICRDCWLEHCLSTNCLGCRWGEYPNCEHLPMKQFYLSETD